MLRSKTPRASGGLELLSYEPGEPEVEPGDGAVGGNSSTEEWRVFSVNSQMRLDPSEVECTTLT